MQIFDVIITKTEMISENYLLLNVKTEDIYMDNSIVLTAYSSTWTKYYLNP